jgi:hypothetical protein
MLRQLSTDSVSSINSLSSACSLSSSAHAPDNSTTSVSKKKKKGWVSVVLYHTHSSSSFIQYCIHEGHCSSVRMKPIHLKNIRLQEQNILIVSEEILHYCSKFMDSVGVNSVCKDLIYFSFAAVKFRLIEFCL